MSAIIRYNEKTKFVTVLCPLGHVVAGRKADPSLAGSSFEAEMGAHAAGKPNRFDRLASQCCGHGH